MQALPPQLTPDEKSALARQVENNLPPLSPKTSSDFLALYLNGYTCAEIQKMNPGFTLGIIVQARIDHKWDHHKAEYIDTLMTQTRETVQKTQLEAVRFASDGMTVYHRLLGQAFRKYLQSGREEDLGDNIGPISVKTYREYVNLFMQLTGQDGEKKSDLPIPVKNEAGVKIIDVAATEGADLLKALDK